ncbi:hypothetical protein LWI29_000864 [Acer saccharum]|uniref:Uncharacterized protein n=1 Tax=Acer saccharum TaxID=4024 RepID=A0AA39RUD9_ACESA|nr:hypothetical protein LWI29_000864 [Acer saccharum]
MIPPRELNISDVDCIYSWGWFSIPDADAYRKRRFGIPDCRFSEVVIRGDLCPFEIGGKITTSLLSPMTTYVAYIVFAENRICWVDDDPAEKKEVELGFDKMVWYVAEDMKVAMGRKGFNWMLEMVDGDGDGDGDGLVWYSGGGVVEKMMSDE